MKNKPSLRLLTLLRQGCSTLLARNSERRHWSPPEIRPAVGKGKFNSVTKELGPVTGIFRTLAISQSINSQSNHQKCHFLQKIFSRFYVSDYFSDFYHLPGIKLGRNHLLLQHCVIRSYSRPMHFKFLASNAGAV